MDHSAIKRLRLELKNKLKTYNFQPGQISLKIPKYLSSFIEVNYDIKYLSVIPHFANEPVIHHKYCSVSAFRDVFLKLLSNNKNFDNPIVHLSNSLDKYDGLSCDRQSRNLRYYAL